jgi:hypothetical protein
MPKSPSTPSPIDRINEIGAKVAAALGLAEGDETTATIILNGDGVVGFSFGELPSVATLKETDEDDDEDDKDEADEADDDDDDDDEEEITESSLKAMSIADLRAFAAKHFDIDGKGVKKADLIEQIFEAAGATEDDEDEDDVEDDDEF